MTQKEAAKQILAVQFWPYLKNVKHTPPEKNCASGFHCSQLKLFQKKGAPTFLPGLMLMMDLCESGALSYRDVQAHFLEDITCTAYL